ncbi:hypothetical protein [Rosistilla oblonga]|uniref:hypothetical protein n=1 Tax=Rosistilla oblonga TaxID=2527990 RepID=UPI003A9868ED
MRKNAARCCANVTWMMALLVTLTTLGCGSDTGGRVDVSGKVTLGGAPLESGTIEILAADGSSQSGATITNGEFSIPAERGLKPGDYIVKIFAGDETVAAVEAAPGDSSAAPVSKERIPPEYNVESTLTAKIEASDNVLSFDIP